MPMSQVAIKEQREKPPRRSGGAAQPRKRAPKAPARSPRSNGAPPKVGPASQNKARGGRRLASAFEVVSELPALAEARRRVTLACEREGSSPTELAEAIESDVALVIAVMSAANNVGSPRGGTGVVREAIERLGRRGVEEAVAEVDTYDPFESPTVAVERYERFRRHAVATRCAADRIAEAARARRGEGLQADRTRAVAVREHDPDPPAQRVPQDRRRRSRAGRTDRPRPRLDLAAGRYSIRLLRSAMATAWTRSRA